MRVIWFWGPTGYGKDRRAAFECQRQGLTMARIAVTKDPQWFDGYSGQQALILSDFKGDNALAEVLSWLDGHPLNLRIKGSFTVALYTTVFVTSIDPPHAFYRLGNGVLELVRRVTDVVEFKVPWRPIGPERAPVVQRIEDSENWEF